MNIMRCGWKWNLKKDIKRNFKRDVIIIRHDFYVMTNQTFLPPERHTNLFQKHNYKALDVTFFKL